jgi:hypothetical protein
MTLDAGGKGTFGIQFTEKYVAATKLNDEQARQALFAAADQTS